MKLELNDWESLAVEVALQELLGKWEKKGAEQAGTHHLKELIDKLWKRKAAKAPGPFQRRAKQLRI